jgi:hypothetical protein
MTTATQQHVGPPAPALDGQPGRWTSEEFHRAHELGLFRPEERLELVHGRICVCATQGQPRRWTREEYYRAADLCLFLPEERLELIKGEIIRKVTVQKRPRALAISISARVLQTAFGPALHVSQQSPLRVSEESEPKPEGGSLRGSRMPGILDREPAGTRSGGLP